MTVAYTLAMPDPDTHLFHVEMRIPATGGGTRLQMPAWTPGSYLVRDYGRHVQDFEAIDGRGRPLPWAREDKHTWHIDAGDARAIRVRYKVYANELTVRSNHLDATHGYANGTSTFMMVEGRRSEDVRLTLRPFKGWHADVSLKSATSRANVFSADDFDHLADSPIEIGTHARLDFVVEGKPHRIAVYGEGNADHERIREDVARIVREEAALFGHLPYESYLFILHLSDKPGGGLEHRASNTSSVHRFTFQPDRKYEDFLSLEAHEFFHTWNVKCVKPAAFTPYDYGREVHTTLLWAMEGVTSYYDHLVLARTGLMAEKRYRDFLAESITKLRAQPGRFVLSLADSSFLTWVKLYKQDENWINTGVSYYLKGELVAFALDLAIRDRTDGRHSLDDVMRALVDRYPASSGGIPEPDGWRETLEDVTGVSWRSFFRKYVDGTDEVDFERFVKKFGWKLRPVRQGDDPEKSREKGEYVDAGGWLGLETKDAAGRLVVRHVLSNSPAMHAGLAVDDELVSMGGHQLRDKDELEHRLREHRPGDSVDLHFFRRRQLVTSRVQLGETPPVKWVLEEDKRASARAKRLRRAWLKPIATDKRPASRSTGNAARGARARVVERGE